MNCEELFIEEIFQPSDPLQIFCPASLSPNQVDSHPTQQEGPSLTY